jgi:hypothetical protein
VGHQKHDQKKEKSGKVDFIEVKNFHFVKDPTKKMKTQAAETLCKPQRSILEYIKNTQNSTVKKKEKKQLETGQEET